MSSVLIQPYFVQSLWLCAPVVTNDTHYGVTENTEIHVLHEDTPK